MKNNVKIQTKWIMGDGIDEYGENVVNLEGKR